MLMKNNSGGFNFEIGSTVTVLTTAALGTYHSKKVLKGIFTGVVTDERKLNERSPKHVSIQATGEYLDEYYKPDKGKDHNKQHHTPYKEKGHDEYHKPYKEKEYDDCHKPYKEKSHEHECHITCKDHEHDDWHMPYKEKGHDEYHQPLHQEKEHNESHKPSYKKKEHNECHKPPYKEKEYDECHKPPYKEKEYYEHHKEKEHEDYYKPEKVHCENKHFEHGKKDEEYLALSLIYPSFPFPSGQIVYINCEQIVAVSVLCKS